jgi:dihydrolipoamide dehydrogenase
MHSQLVVLGGGPCGYAAAFLAADQGMEVTLVESERRLGGTCLLCGCIPSKALLHVARVMAEADELSANWGVQFSRPVIQLDVLRERKEKLVATLSGGLGQLAKRRNVRVICARGQLVDSTTLRLEPSGEPDVPEGSLTFEHAVLATGSIPATLPAFNIGSSRVLNSTTALQLSQIPESLLVIGGGYIGLELGTVYAQLGSQVSVVELTDGLLPGADRDLVKPLQRRLATLFDDRIFLSTSVTKLTDLRDAIEVEMEGPAGAVVQRYSHVLVSVGRRPASGQLGLENTSVSLDARQAIVTDANQRTSDPHILAIGDVTGDPMLAHRATHQAKVAVDTLLGRNSVPAERTIPAVVFTDPEIAWAGLTETQAKAEGRTCQIALYPWAASGRAHSLGRPDGLTKWLVEPETDRLLGCGICGPGAGELIGEAVVAIDRRCTVTDIAHAIHPHPTLSETLMNAADAHLGSAIEIYKPRRR